MQFYFAVTFYSSIKAEPDQQSSLSNGDLNTTDLLFDPNEVGGTYWGLTVSYDDEKIWANNVG